MRVCPAKIMRHYYVGSDDLVPPMHMDANVSGEVSSSNSPVPPGWCSLGGMFPCGLPALSMWREWWILDIPNKLK